MLEKLVYPEFSEILRFFIQNNMHLLSRSSFDNAMVLLESN